MPAVRILVIGAGPAAVSMHFPVLASLRDAGEIVLAVVCDIDRGRAAAARRQFAFEEDTGDGIAALRRADLDAVYVFGSAQLHFEYGLSALRRGKHLFVEKPIAPTYAEALQLARAAQARSLIAAGGHNRRFYKSLSLVRDRAGKARWRSAEATFHKPEFGSKVPFGARSWLTANGIHALDAMLYAMGGLPEEVTALAANTGTQAPSVFAAVMRWPDGAQGTFLCNNHAGSRREEYAFHAIAETCRITDDTFTIERDNTATSTPLMSLGDGVLGEHRAFLQAVRDGRRPPHSISDIAPSLFLAELIESGYSGPVRIPPLGQEADSTHDQATVSILLDKPLVLRETLGRLLPRYRLVSAEDVHAAAHSRPDIEAAILGHGSSGLSLAMLDKLPRLAVVGIVGLSIGRHQPEALLARGITLVNASAAYAESVAEFALGLAILARRRAFSSHAAMRAGEWGTGSGLSALHQLIRAIGFGARPIIRALGLEPLALRLWRRSPKLRGDTGQKHATSSELRGAAVGLIGWGANARAFALMLVKAGARVLVYSEHAEPSDIVKTGAIQTSLDEVLASDIVSLHRGLTPNTRHFLSAAELAKLRPGVVFINVARGALVDADALLARLKQGDIFACLDTYEEEPLSRSHPLRKMKNVFLTSHIAGGSRDMHAAAAEEVVQKIIAHLEGVTVKSISKEQLRTMT
jgi:phosphoglycerate dehydrogenase-like enzyme/predicted dehydrogenase